MRHQVIRTLMRDYLPYSISFCQSDCCFCNLGYSGIFAKRINETYYRENRAFLRLQPFPGSIAHTPRSARYIRPPPGGTRYTVIQTFAGIIRVRWASRYGCFLPFVLLFDAYCGLAYCAIMALRTSFSSFVRRVVR